MEELAHEEAVAVLRRNRLGHLGLAQGGRAYVLPLFYGFNGRALYFHSHPGLKEEYLRSTEEACFAVTNLRTIDDWTSVLVYGQVERVDTADEIREAMDVLMSVPLPPDWGFSSTTGEPHRSGKDMFFWKLTPRNLSGRKSRRHPTDEDVDMG